MRNLIAFLAKYNHWFVFVLLEVVSLVLLFQFNNYQGSVWFTSANCVSGKVYEWNSAIESFFSMKELNQKLTRHNLHLEQQIARMQENLTRTANDSMNLHKTKQQVQSEFKLYPAKVISNNLDKVDNLITIDKGAADGIRKDMGVACGNGVVGVVYMVSTHYSIVIPVLNSHSNISCMIRGRGYFGYLRWYGGDPTIAYVDDIPRHARFKTGMSVVTSGYSSIFPPGIMVGKIKRVYNSPNGYSYRLMVELATDFSNLRDVCVIDNTGMEEKIEIMRSAQDSLKARQN